MTVEKRGRERYPTHKKNGPITFRVLQFRVSKVWILVGPVVWTKESALLYSKRRDRIFKPLSEREREKI